MTERRKGKDGHKAKPVASLNYETVYVHEDLCQAMPGGRTRINPRHIAHLQAWIIAFTEHWQKESCKTTRGLVGLDLVREERRIKTYEHYVKAAQQLLDGLIHTVSTDRFELHVEVWKLAQLGKGNSAIPCEVAECNAGNDTCPDC